MTQITSNELFDSCFDSLDDLIQEIGIQVHEAVAAAQDADLLIAAARAGDLLAVKALLSQRPEAARATREHRMTALMAAAQAGAAHCVEALLPLSDPNAYCDPLPIDPAANDGCSMTASRNALAFAARGGHLECVKLLSAAGNAASANKEGQTALMVAAYYGRAECVEVLLSVSDGAATEQDGWTALMAAACNGHAECVRLLLSACDAAAVMVSGLTALMIASAKGHARCVELLLPASDAAAADADGNTALLLAACDGHAECVILLLPASGQASAANHEGWTALMVAACNGHAPCVKMLLAASDADAIKADGSTALALMAAARNGHAKCVELLLPVSDASVADHDGWTALMMAACNGHAKCVELLLPASDASVANRDGWTALMVAACNGHAPCVELLLPVSDACAVSADGRSALRLAAARVADSGGCLAVVELLSGGGAARSSCPGGFTPLIAAVKSGRNSEEPASWRLVLEAVRALAPRSDANAIGADGLTALDWALDGPDLDHRASEWFRPGTQEEDAKQLSAIRMAVVQELLPFVDPRDAARALLRATWGLDGERKDLLLSLLPNSETAKIAWECTLWVAGREDLPRIVAKIEHIELTETVATPSSAPRRAPRI